MIPETSLLFKTMFILCGQLIVVLGTCFYCIREARKAYEANTSFAGLYFRGSMNMNKELDLVPYTPPPTNFPCAMYKEVPSKWDFRKSSIVTIMANDKEQRIELIKDGYFDKESGGYVFLVFLLWAIPLLICTLFAITGISTQLGLIFFTLSSLTLGPLLAFIMLEMDENDGFKALKIVFFVTLITGVIGYSDVYSFSESSLIGRFLFISLVGLIGFEFIRLFRGFSRKAIRYKAFFGIFIFSMYLLYDFNLLRKNSDYGVNDWDTAFSIALSLYLDIINLLLEILDAMSN